MKYMGRAELKMPRDYIASDAGPDLSQEEIEKRCAAKEHGQEIRSSSPEDCQ